MPSERDKARVRASIVAVFLAIQAIMVCVVVIAIDAAQMAFWEPFGLSKWLAAALLFGVSAFLLLIQVAIRVFP